MAYIPYGAYWSTPFARWQGALAHLHSLRFAARVAKQTLAAKSIALGDLDYGVLGTTVPQQSSFYGLPWLTGMMGADHVAGPTVNQACATGARILQMAAQAVEAEDANCALAIAADRISNGPHIYYPAPDGPGGTGQAEDWVMDNFANDPYAQVAMIETAENAARRYQIDTQQQHDVVLARHEQYESANARGFQNTFMTLPFPVPDAKGRNTGIELDGDEGIYATSADKLARLTPVRESGSVTFGGQTHPADGNAGMLICSRDKARELSARPEIEIRLAAFGQARTEKAMMPYAPVPAAAQALQRAEKAIADMAAVKTHNPFAVNDVLFAAETGYPLEKMNNNGCSLIWGHPQGPTGLRSVIELIEELVELGGGSGLFSGCAAGDSAMAVVVEVTDAD